MIGLADSNGHLVKCFPIGVELELGYHPKFGFASRDTVTARNKLRSLKNQSIYNENSWECRFRVTANQLVQAIEGCRVEALAQGQFQILTGRGAFKILPLSEMTPVTHKEPDDEDRLGPAVGVVFLMLLMCGIFATFRFLPTHVETEKTLKEALAEQKAVAVPKVKVVEAPKPAVPVAPVEVVAAKVVQKQNKGGALAQQNLGFLSLLGKKELTKAMGGMPTQVTRTTAGAGKGGDQGSGGEMLTGLGQGLKQTTVGNTGVKGLGGIGNAGAGGGAGGFGQSYVGSGGAGGGRVLSNVTLSKDVELDGGLDKSVIEATISRYLSQIRACYERRLKVVPGLQGQVTMDFEVGAEGRLNYARVQKSSLNDQDVEGCISKVMLGWNFPKPVGGTLTKVNYPFVLKPSAAM